MLLFLLMTYAFALPQPVQVDLHLDTPSQMFAKKLSLDHPGGLEAGLAQLRAGGTNVAVQVLWPPRKSAHREHAYALLDIVERAVTHLDSVDLATDPAQARAVAAKGRLAVLISMEGAHGLGDDADWRQTFLDFERRGLRLLGLTWSFSNRFGGSSGDQGGGLTAEGRTLVKLARDRGVVLDVSHASRVTTMEVCKDSPVPVIASHSNAWALAEHPRNLTDREIRCIAATGGVIGLNFHAPFVGSGADVEMVANHADHLAKVGGHAVVALGTDFDGYIRKPSGLEDASKIPALWAEMRRRGWTPAQLRGVQGENFMRAWAAVRAGAAGR
jgi:membrane dipeptidase